MTLYVTPGDPQALDAAEIPVTAHVEHDTITIDLSGTSVLSRLLDALHLTGVEDLIAATAPAATSTTDLWTQVAAGLRDDPRVCDALTITTDASGAEALAEHLYDALNEITVIEPTDADQHNTDAWDAQRDEAAGA